LERVLGPSRFIWPPGRKLKKKEKEEIQAVERECDEKAAKLVCYRVKGFKRRKTVKVKVKVLPKWRNKLLKESNIQINLLKLMRKDHRDQLEEALNTALRRDVLNSLFPADSGLRNVQKILSECLRTMLGSPSCTTAGSRALPMCM
jgi:hypothetical protein